MRANPAVSIQACDFSHVFLDDIDYSQGLYIGSDTSDKITNRYITASSKMSELPVNNGLFITNSATTDVAIDLSSYQALQDSIWGSGTETLVTSPTNVFSWGIR